MWVGCAFHGGRTAVTCLRNAGAGLGYAWCGGAAAFVAAHEQGLVAQPPVLVAHLQALADDVHYQVCTAEVGSPSSQADPRATASLARLTHSPRCSMATRRRGTFAAA